MSDIVTQDTLLRPDEVAERLGISTATLYRLSRGDAGPVYVQVSPRRRRYRPDDVARYLENSSR